MKYTMDQFEPGEAWLIFRIDCFTQDQPVDIYLLIDMASTYLFWQILVPGELPDENEVKIVMKKAYQTKKRWPKILFCPERDPAEEFFIKLAEKHGFSFKPAPLSRFEEIVGPIKKSFSRGFYSPMATVGGFDEEEPLNAEKCIAQAFIPDSYDLCSCASGLKYKFCCKPILVEITEAMTAAENGDLKEALKWMDAARSKVGETGEVLCRCAIVYAFFDQVKSDEYLNKCLSSFPNHPRANYVLGLERKERGDLQGALRAYQTAIDHYPPTDRYHLNETWNNLGNVYYALSEYFAAKTAWEKALSYLPEDPTATENLHEFIYENPDISEEIKGNRNIH